jgi:hypothetical protein
MVFQSSWCPDINANDLSFYWSFQKLTDILNSNCKTEKVLQAVVFIAFEDYYGEKLDTADVLDI